MNLNTTLSKYTYKKKHLRDVHAILGVCVNIEQLMIKRTTFQLLILQSFVNI